MTDIKDDILQILKDALKETGTTIKKSAKEVAAYASMRAEHLSKEVGKPGFAMAVRVERDNVILFAGIKTAAGMEEANAKIMGVIQGLLAFGAKLLIA
jgi:hypothetical protein